ncbi:MAG: zf-HC2 domain-containing protein [Elusimicrobiaceae bacterium]|nr:zf-HC2 domain-containing protein [Elusimicrobiaceae bacterium]MBQ6223597.1 zf-HC2 domain-containing protein [Campylobacter sp.]
MPHSKIFEEQALLYAYGELEDSKEKAFLRHLETCKKCQATINTISLTNVALEEYIAPTLNMRKILGKPWWSNVSDLFRNTKFSRPLLLGGAAACCLAVVVGFFQLNKPASNGYIYFADSIYDQVGLVEADIDSLLQDINSL